MVSLLAPWRIHKGRAVLPHRVISVDGAEDACLHTNPNVIVFVCSCDTGFDGYGETGDEMWNIMNAYIRSYDGPMSSNFQTRFFIFNVLSLCDYCCLSSTPLQVLRQGSFYRVLLGSIGTYSLRVTLIYLDIFIDIFVCESSISAHKIGFQTNDIQQAIATSPAYSKLSRYNCQLLGCTPILKHGTPLPNPQ